MISTKLFKLVAVPILLASYVSAAANSLRQVSNFGTNPTNVGMYVYTPTGLVSNPALIVAMHYCTGTAQAYFGGTKYANLADQYKSYMVIYPNAPDSGGCWDVHTTATLTHDAGGDSLGIASMIRYAIANYGVDPKKVYITGSSSGAMMSSVLAGAYPDLFVASSAYAGVPYSCFSGSGMWNSACANGQISKTGQQWGDLVRNGYPGYTGPRPRVQIWHGTQDSTLSYNNFLEEIKLWNNVFGYSSTPASSVSNDPISGWTRMTYGPNFQAISTPTTHDLPVQEVETLKWFGIIGGGPTSSTSSSSTITDHTTGGPTSTSSHPVSTTTTASGATQTHWGQCGGIGYTGPTACASPYTCTYSNAYYSQCL